jgi:excisionase family DNA binding protein
VSDGAHSAPSGGDVATAPAELGQAEGPPVVRLAPEQLEALAQRVAELLRAAPPPSSPRPRKPRPGYLTLPEVAERCRAPLSSVRSWIYSGRLAARKVGRRVLVAEGDLARFMGEGEGGTTGR